MYGYPPNRAAMALQLQQMQQLQQLQQLRVIQQLRQQQQEQQMQQQQLLQLQHQQHQQMPPSSPNENAAATAAATAAIGGNNFLCQPEPPTEVSAEAEASDEDLSSPLAMTDLKPSVLIIFQRLIKEYVGNYDAACSRDSINGDDTAHAEAVVAAIHGGLVEMCAPFAHLVKEFPQRDRLCGLIRSSLGFLLELRKNATQANENNHNTNHNAQNNNEQVAQAAEVVTEATAKAAIDAAVATVNEGEPKLPSEDADNDWEGLDTNSARLTLEPPHPMMDHSNDLDIGSSSLSNFNHNHHHHQSSQATAETSREDSNLNSGSGNANASASASDDNASASASSLLWMESPQAQRERERERESVLRPSMDVMMRYRQEAFLQQQQQQQQQQLVMAALARSGGGHAETMQSQFLHRQPLAQAQLQLQQALQAEAQQRAHAAQAAMQQAMQARQQHQQHQTLSSMDLIGRARMVQEVLQQRGMAANGNDNGASAAASTGGPLPLPLPLGMTPMEALHGPTPTPAAGDTAASPWNYVPIPTPATGATATVTAAAAAAKKSTTTTTGDDCSEIHVGSESESHGDNTKGLTAATAADATTDASGDAASDEADDDDADDATNDAAAATDDDASDDDAATAAATATAEFDEDEDTMAMRNRLYRRRYDKTKPKTKPKRAKPKASPTQRLAAPVTETVPLASKVPLAPTPASLAALEAMAIPAPRPPPGAPGRASFVARQARLKKVTKKAATKKASPVPKARLKKAAAQKASPAPKARPKNIAANASPTAPKKTTPPSFTAGKGKKTAIVPRDPRYPPMEKPPTPALFTVKKARTKKSPTKSTLAKESFSSGWRKLYDPTNHDSDSDYDPGEGKPKKSASLTAGRGKTKKATKKMAPIPRDPRYPPMEPSSSGSEEESDPSCPDSDYDPKERKPPKNDRTKLVISEKARPKKATPTLPKRPKEPFSSGGEEEEDHSCHDSNEEEDDQSDHESNEDSDEDCKIPASFSFGKGRPKKATAKSITYARTKFFSSKKPNRRKPTGKVAPIARKSPKESHSGETQDTSSYHDSDSDYKSKEEHNNDSDEKYNDDKEYNEESDGDDSFDLGFARIVSPESKEELTKLPSHSSKPKTPTPKWNLEGSKLTDAAKRRLRKLAPFNSDGNETWWDGCDFDGHGQPQKSRRTRKPRLAAITATAHISATAHDRFDEIKTTVKKIINRKRKRTRSLPTTSTQAEPATKLKLKRQSLISASSPSSQGASSWQLMPISDVAHKTTKKRKSLTRKRLLPYNSKGVNKEKPSNKLDSIKTILPNASSPSASTNKPKKARPVVERGRKKRPTELTSMSSYTSLRETSLSKPSLDGVAAAAAASSDLPPSRKSSSRADDEYEPMPPVEPIPDEYKNSLSASVLKALKRLAPHNYAGTITAGDHTFALQNALNQTLPKRSARRSRQQSVRYT